MLSNAGKTFCPISPLYKHTVASKKLWHSELHPLHVAAFMGNPQLFEFVQKRTGDYGPKNKHPQTFGLGVLWVLALVAFHELGRISLVQESVSCWCLYQKFELELSLGTSPRQGWS